ncbi:MAG: TonB-dependent receptor [Pseudomonadota bacterium]
MKRTLRGRFGQKYLFAGVSAAVLSVALPLSTMAQETTDEESVQETITVTGSRIPTDPNLTSSTPVQSLSSDDFTLSGELNLADVVNDIPALVSSLTAENSVTGANALNLRGLGSDRTLTLVNGRRHVAGFRGSQAVDVGSIPRALVERVEVTTGGASAVYGADAVTGVVNFILKDDFEGFQLDARGGVSGEGDAENFAIDALYGQNYADGRGNLVFAFSFEDDSQLTHGDRDWSRDNGIASVEPRANPDALTDPNAPPQAVIEDPRFWLTSREGSIAPTFGGRDVVYVDINGNGIADCQESEGGRVGFLAGCWLTNPDGSVRVNQDGVVLNGLWGTGGDGVPINENVDTLFPETDKIVLNFNTTYDVSDTVGLFFEGKYVNARSETFNAQDTFYDTLFILPDNPFIPSELTPVTDITDGLLLTQDPIDFSDNNPSKFTRETWRFVGGVDWEFAEGHFAEFSANYGRFKNTSRETGLYLDRVFAAIDAVEAPDGSIVCRSDLDPTAAYEIDYFTAGNGYADGGFSSDRYYSFTPGDGQCQPLNPFGRNSVSPEAQDFITSNLEDVLVVEQLVISAIATGDFDVLDSLLDGPVGYAAGIEYREESSDNQLDPLTLGILPEGTSFTPGIQVSEVDPFLFSFTDIDNSQQFNTEGSYEVYDIFTEIRLPIFRDRPFAKELTLDGAVRLADYSTLGEATTWKIGGTWAPVSDLSFRATVSEAVRAPNISELFDPPLPITVAATADICDADQIGGGTQFREENCVAGLRAAGVAEADIFDADGNFSFANPLTGRFTGVEGGNPNLDAETAETLTVGAVFQPSFFEGFSLTVDYWDVEIEQGIDSVTGSNTIINCYDADNSGGDLSSNDFCNRITRRTDGGIGNVDLQLINFAGLEASGIDFSVNYSFDVGENTFGASLVGSKQESLDLISGDSPEDVDTELREIQIPEYSGNLTLSWDRGPFSAALQTTYQSEQAVDEIEVVAGINGRSPLYGDDGFFDEVYIFDANASYEFSDQLTFYGGVNNIADEEPYATETAWPVGPRGRFFFFGLTYTQ